MNLLVSFHVNSGFLLAALSPQATLLRGYSITRVGGKAITSPDDIPAGTILETTLALGTLLSVKK